MGESKIWRLTSTREFRPLWVNGDGTSDAASFWYFASAQQVHVSPTVPLFETY
jgi:hypothetical protein